MKPRVVVTCALPGRATLELDRDADVVILSDDGDVTAERLGLAVKDADGLLCMLTDRIPGDLLRASGRLKIVGNCAVGFDNIDVAAATELGIQVVNTPNVLTDATADLTWALLLAAARRVVEADRYVRGGSFRRWQVSLMLGLPVYGRTLGIVGLGRIGRAVARRALGFEMTVLYTQRERAGTDVENAVGARFATKERLMADSDFVSLHVPLTRETRYYLDRSALAAMKPTAVVINTSRGAVIDEAALVEALCSGRLAAAALDVYEGEPIVHPALLALDNVVLAPHIGSATSATRAAMAEAVAQDIARYLRGDPPLNPVNHPPMRREA